jgi:hypothetical protein
MFRREEEIGGQWLLTDTFKGTPRGHGDAVAPCSLPYAETESNYRGEPVGGCDEDVDAPVGEVAKGCILHGTVHRHYNSQRNTS